MFAYFNISALKITYPSIIVIRNLTTYTSVLVMFYKLKQSITLIFTQADNINWLYLGVSGNYAVDVKRLKENKE